MEGKQSSVIKPGQDKVQEITGIDGPAAPASPSFPGVPTGPQSGSLHVGGAHSSCDKRISLRPRVPWDGLTHSNQEQRTPTSPGRSPRPSCLPQACTAGLLSLSSPDTGAVLSTIRCPAASPGSTPDDPPKACRPRACHPSSGAESWARGLGAFLLGVCA